MSNEIRLTERDERILIEKLRGNDVRADERIIDRDWFVEAMRNSLREEVARALRLLIASVCVDDTPHEPRVIVVQKQEGNSTRGADNNE